MIAEVVELIHGSQSFGPMVIDLGVGLQRRRGRVAIVDLPEPDAQTIGTDSLAYLQQDILEDWDFSSLGASEGDLVQGVIEPLLGGRADSYEC